MTKTKTLLYVKAAGVAAAVCLGAAAAPSASAQTDDYLGEIRPVGFPFCPAGWVEANGALLAIQSYDSLYSLYGTIYGGDGRTKFGVPDLRGRTSIGAGEPPGMPPYKVGSKGGATTVTIPGQSLAHGHDATTNVVMHATTADATTDTPGPTVALAKSTINIYGAGNVDELLLPAAATAQTTVSTTGGGPIALRGPAQAIKWCISTTGIYPPPHPG